MNCFIVCFVAVSWAEGEPRPRPPLARSQSSYLSTDFEECPAPEGPAVENVCPRSRPESVPETERGNTPSLTWPPRGPQ